MKLSPIFFICCISSCLDIHFTKLQLRIFNLFPAHTAAQTAANTAAQGVRAAMQHAVKNLEGAEFHVK